MNAHNSFVPVIITIYLDVKAPYDNNDVLFVASIQRFLKHLIY